MICRFFKNSSWYAFLLYLCCFVIVLLYVHTFILWAWLKAVFGSVANYLPVLSTVLLLVAIGWYGVYLHRRKRKLAGAIWLYGSLALTITAFFIPDPEFPVKRIHVVQYFLLTFLVRYPLSHYLKGRTLTFYTFVVTWIFGIHDELLQGLHPLRTFGLRDIMVDGCAALGGSLFTHFIALYSPSSQELNLQKQQQRPGPAVGAAAAIVLLFMCMVMAMALYLVPLTAYRYDHIPYWLASPLMGTLAAWALCIDTRVTEKSNHGLAVVLWLVAILPLYPFIANVSSLQFN